MNPVFYDCEATGPSGYPIEVGWAYIDELGALISESHLIRPPAEWDIKSVWDEQAEASRRPRWRMRSRNIHFFKIASHSGSITTTSPQRRKETCFPPL